MKKILLPIILLLLVAIGAGIWLYDAFYGNCVKERHSLFVYASYPYEQVADSVDQYIGKKWAYDLYAKRLGLKESLKSGHYVLEKGMSVIEVVRMLKLGLQTPVNVTMNNVKTPAYLAGKLSHQLHADSVELVKVLTDKDLAQKLGFSSPLTMFSIFIPNTYEFYWTVTPEDFVDRMYKEYKRFWTGERDKKRERSGLNRVEVSTLASIVYEETRKVDEMPRVAGVYVNRLKQGIPLQADPTIKYAMQDFGLRRILYRHLKYESPYNTYLHRGLPPSPICMPSIEAIDAVLNFEKHDYIFFCARPTFDGYHNFARTLKEHNANARAYQAELNKRKIK
ncbi:MAG: endolytic transglycosylase MltG [Alistipes sp.]|nr:endolytic transglycosylase MltG [Alistipes sp.]